MCPAFSATSAMTTGSATKIADQGKPGRCAEGSPNQSALLTPDRSSRQWSTVFPLPPGERIRPKTRSKPQDIRWPTTSPREIAIRDQNPRRHTTAGPVSNIVVRAVHWFCGQ